MYLFANKYIILNIIMKISDIFENIDQLTVFEQIVNEHKSGQWLEGQGQDKPFMRGDLYYATYAVKVQPYPAIRKKVRDFMDLKRTNPTASFGSSDKTFSSDGILNSYIPGLRHAHITFDLSVVYRIVDKQIYLYGFFTHDDLGTGQPRNINRQKNAAQRLSHQNFKE